MQKSIAIIIGVFFVVGLFVLGVSIKSALQPQQDKFITLSVSASKIVHANGILWPIELINSDDNLSRVLDKAQKDKDALKQFFIDAGVDESDIAFEEIQVINAKEGNDAYGAVNLNKEFLATQNAFIQSSNIQAVKKAQDKIPELIKQGVVLKYVRYKGDSYF
ncbi:MAG: hypothetical protein LBG21_01020, partial [Campylobacteraceae bacterium]|nr:hypothetical protein [Campylobacteraceae bacterium]